MLDLLHIGKHNGFGHNSSEDCPIFDSFIV